jgi:hypothetical protein
MMRDSLDKAYLLGLRYALVILDESHKARSRQGFGKEAGTPNELLTFMRDIAARSDHVLLGTATPIQTKPEDLWDQMGILHQEKGNFVLGHDLTKWHRPEEVLPILSGEQEVTEPSFAWELLRSPLPLVNSTKEPHARQLYSAIRQDSGMRDDPWRTSITDLDDLARDDLENELYRRIAGASFFQRENPLVRHVVLRKRTALENEGLLTKIGVDIHPSSNLSRELQVYHALFEGQALRTSDDFREAYAESRNFGKALGRRGRGGGFMKNLMEQRICSSIAAGLNTARKLLQGRTIHEEDDDREIDLAAESGEERIALERLVHRLEQVDGDPKLRAIIHYLEGEQWLDHGVIIFSQYYDTARWVAEVGLPDWPHGGNAPFRSAVISRSARPLAMAYRNTCPQFCFALCAVS